MHILAFLILSLYPFGQNLADEPLTLKVINDGRAYLGYTYRTRVDTGHIFDCSGFVSHLLFINGIDVSRSSASMAKEVEVIPLEDTRPGDLLFFKGRDLNARHIGHVAMVVERDGDKIFMMHATRRGIVIDAYKDGYYTRRFVHAGRLPKLTMECLDPFYSTSDQVE